MKTPYDRLAKIYTNCHMTKMATMPIYDKNPLNIFSRRYIFLWVVGVESFQIIWVIGIRPNLITRVVGVSLRGRGRKNIICQKKERSFYLI